MKKPYRRILDDLLAEQADLSLPDAEGKYQPYSSPATRLWEDYLTRHPDDHATLHHLAIAEHAHAFDIERKHPGGARRYWDHALHYWSRLLSHSEFWRSLSDEAASMGDEFRPSTLQDLRDELPQALLNVHKVFIERYVREGQLKAAREHMHVLSAAPFSTDLKTDLIDGLFSRFVGEIDVEQANPDQLQGAFSKVEHFLQIAPDHARSLYLAVAITNRLNDLVWAAMTAAGHRDESSTLCEMAKNLRRAEPWLRRLKASAGTTAGDPTLDAMKVREALAEQFHVLGLACDRQRDASGGDEKASLSLQLDYYQQSLRWDPQPSPRALKSYIEICQHLIELCAGEEPSSKKIASLLARARKVLPGTAELASVERLAQALQVIAEEGRQEEMPSLEALLSPLSCGVQNALIVARAYARADKFPEAYALLDEAHTRFPDASILLFWQARICLEKDRFQDAEASFQRFLKSAPPELRAQGAWLGEEIRRQDKVSGITERIEAVETEFESDAGSTDRAVGKLQILLRDAPPDTMVYLRLTTAFLRIGCRDGARQSYDKMLGVATEEEREATTWLEEMLLV